MARHSGADLDIQFSATEAGTYATLGCFTQWSLNKTRDRFEVTCGGDANKVYVVGKSDFAVTGTAIFDDENSAVWDAADLTTPQFYRLLPDLANIPAYFWQGPFYLDASLDVPVGGAITMGVNMAAADSITNPV